MDCHLALGLIQFDLRAQVGEELEGGPDIDDEWQVLERDRLGGEERRGDHGQSGIFIAGCPMGSADTLFSMNDQFRHDKNPTKIRCLPCRKSLGSLKEATISKIENKGQARRRAIFRIFGQPPRQLIASAGH